MSEDEAMDKWCPFARVGQRWMKAIGATEQAQDLNVVSVNRGTNVGDSVNCIGSACMAWRWHYVEFSEDGQRRDTWADLAPFGAAEQLLKRHGYCGLAGDPPPQPPAGYR